MRKLVIALAILLLPTLAIARSGGGSSGGTSGSTSIHCVFSSFLHFIGLLEGVISIESNSSEILESVSKNVRNCRLGHVS